MIIGLLIIGVGFAFMVAGFVFVVLSIIEKRREMKHKKILRRKSYSGFLSELDELLYSTDISS